MITRYPASVLEFSDYKKFLNDLADSRPRGFRKALATASHCQTAYITHVLSGPGHFNLEQAEAITRFLEMGVDEIRYFLTLVEFGRAGTTTLKKVLSDQLTEMRERYLLLQKRVGISRTLSRENQATYYSSWHYAAVHMAVTIPRLRSRRALGQALRIGPRKLNEVLEFLTSVGIIRREGDEFHPDLTQLHLEKNSPLIFQHHGNLRSQALASLHDTHAENALHYSSYVSLSEEAAQKIRAMITQNLSEWIQVIKDAKEEQLFGLGIDFFRVDQ